jgi:hypothetical protein
VILFRAGSRRQLSRYSAILSNAIRRSCLYTVLMTVIAGIGGYAIHRYWVSANLTRLQRVYFNQYLTSSYRSYLPNSMSR